MKKKKKNCWRYHLRICTKKRNIMMYASWDMESGRHNFLSFWAIFCPITPILTLKINIWKKLKSAWKYYPFTRVQLKWRSCDVWFLRYKAGWTVFFVILCHFLLFDPPNNPKNQSFEKMKKKKHLEISFYACIPQMIIWCMVPEILSMTEFFVILPFYPTNNLKSVKKKTSLLGYWSEQGTNCA